MSSLGAIFHFDDRPLEPGDLERMGQALATGGPHGQGRYLDKTWGMSFHLRRFTPEDLYERQPLKDPRERYWILADARLDNRDELLREFAITPTEAAKLPDSRLILLAFERWGENCPGKLIGDFAFLVWDRQARRLFAACDPMGRRTLLYHRAPSRLAVATAYKGLHALSWVPRELDQDRLADFLVMRPMPPGSTMHRGIERLPPAHSLATDGEHWTVKRYWRLDPEREIRLSNDDEYREAFLELYGKAIHAHLRSSGPIGIAMSGGLDSSSVAAMAARELHRQGKTLTAFTMVHNRSFDPGIRIGNIEPEYPYVEAIRRMHPNIEVVYLTGKGVKMLDGFEDTFEMVGVPSNSITYDRHIRTLYPEVRARGIGVFLNGHSGNRTISYNGADFLPHAFLTGRWRTVYEGIQALRPLRRRTALQLFRAHVLGPFLPDGFVFRRPPWRSLFGLDEKYSRRPGGAGSDAPSLLHNWRRLLNPRLRYSDAFIIGLMHNAMDEWVATRAEMGIEERDPSGDLRIVEFCMALPMHQYLRKGRNRFLIRHAMAGLLPEVVRWQDYYRPREPDYGEHIELAMAEIGNELNRLERHRDQLGLLDFEQLRALQELPRAEQAKSTYLPCRRLMRGVQVGKFIRWAEGHND